MYYEKRGPRSWKHQYSEAGRKKAIHVGGVGPSLCSPSLPSSFVMARTFETSAKGICSDALPIFQPTAFRFSTFVWSVASCGFWRVGSSARGSSETWLSSLITSKYHRFLYSNHWGSPEPHRALRAVCVANPMVPGQAQKQKQMHFGTKFSSFNLVNLFHLAHQTSFQQLMIIDCR